MKHLSHTNLATALHKCSLHTTICFRCQFQEKLWSTVQSLYVQAWTVVVDVAGTVCTTSHSLQGRIRPLSLSMVNKPGWQHRFCCRVSVEREEPPSYRTPRTWARVRTDWTETHSYTFTLLKMNLPSAADISGGSDPLLAWGWEWVVLMSRRSCWLSQWCGGERRVSRALRVNPLHRARL